MKTERTLSRVELATLNVELHFFLLNFGFRFSFVLVTFNVELLDFSIFFSLLCSSLLTVKNVKNIIMANVVLSAENLLCRGRNFVSAAAAMPGIEGAQSETPVPRQASYLCRGTMLKKSNSPKSESSLPRQT